MTIIDIGGEPMTKPVNIEVRNPRYAGATPGDLVRALMQRPPKRKDEEPEKPDKKRRKKAK